MTRGHIKNVVASVVIGGGMLALASGCGNSSKAYAPSASSAKEALESSLSAWQKGSKPDQLASGTPPIHPVDFQWQEGQALESYQVLADEPDGEDASKHFSVSLKLKKSKGETKTRYVVMGRDPIWVYREDDYTKMLNMDDSSRPKPVRRRR